MYDKHPTKNSKFLVHQRTQLGAEIGSLGCMAPKSTNKKEIVVLQRKNQFGKKNKKHRPMANIHPSPNDPIPPTPPSKPTKMGFWHYLVPKKHQKTATKKKLLCHKEKTNQAKKQKTLTHAQAPTTQPPPPPLQNPPKWAFGTTKKHQKKHQKTTKKNASFLGPTRQSISNIGDGRLAHPWRAARE